jgi:hypothetical protein
LDILRISKLPIDVNYYSKILKITGDSYDSIVDVRLSQLRVLKNDIGMNKTDFISTDYKQYLDLVADFQDNLLKDRLLLFNYRKDILDL